MFNILTEIQSNLNTLGCFSVSTPLHANTLTICHRRAAVLQHLLSLIHELLIAHASFNGDRA